MRTIEENKNKPWVDNYPDLKGWLRRIDARGEHQLPIGSAEAPTAYLEIWSRRGVQFCVLVHANNHGWQLFTPTNSNMVNETLRDAEERLGVKVMP